MADFDKDKIIKASMAKFKKIFKDKPEDKRYFAEQIYQYAAFFKATAIELMEQVKQKGIVGERTNGNGFVTRDTTPEYKELKDTVRSLNGCIDSLGKLCPEIKKDIKGEADELMSFLGNAKK